MSLSEKIVKGGCIEDCACNKGDKDYHDELKEYMDVFFLDVKDVREAVKELKKSMPTLDNDLKEEIIPEEGVYTFLLNQIDEIFGEKLI